MKYIVLFEFSIEWKRKVKSHDLIAFPSNIFLSKRNEAYDTFCYHCTLCHDGRTANNVRGVLQWTSRAPNVYALLVFDTVDLKDAFHKKS